MYMAYSELQFWLQIHRRHGHWLKAAGPAEGRDRDRPVRLALVIIALVEGLIIEAAAIYVTNDRQLCIRLCAFRVVKVLDDPIVSAVGSQLAVDALRRPRLCRHLHALVVVDGEARRV